MFPDAVFGLKKLTQICKLLFLEHLLFLGTTVMDVRCSRDRAEFSLKNLASSLCSAMKLTLFFLYRIEFIQGMGRGVKRVAKAEKGREKERVEKWGPAVATWRVGGRELGVRGQERKRVRGKLNFYLVDMFIQLAFKKLFDIVDSIINYGLSPLEKY
jgi:hypothetical protein